MIFQKLQDELSLLDLSSTYRDWGQSIVLSSEAVDGEVVNRQKMLIIKPGAALPLHKHVNYAELWIADRPFRYILENASGELIEHDAAAYERVYVPRNRQHKIMSTELGVTIFELHMGTIEDHDNIKCE